MEGYGHGKLKVVAGRLGRVYAAAAKFKSFSNNTAAAVVASCTFVKTKMSLRYAREHLLLAFDDAMISEEEFVLLFDHNKSSNLDLRYDQYPLFDLDDMEDDECLAEFRVRKRDIPLLEEALQIPEEFTLEQRSVVGGNGRFMHAPKEANLSMQVWRYVTTVWSTGIRVVYGHKLGSGPHLCDPSSTNQPLEC